MAEPLRLVVTAKVGKEERARRELEDLLYRIDPGVRVIQTRYRDVLLVFSSIDSTRIFEEVRRTPPYSVARAVRIDKCCKPGVEDIVRACIELGRTMLSGKERLRVECVKRGSAIQSCRAVEITVGISMERAGLATADPRNPSRVIKIEVIDDLACIGIIRPGEDKLHRHLRVSSSFHNNSSYKEFTR